MVDFRDLVEVAAAQQDSDRPLPPLAMLAATSHGWLEDAKRRGYAKLC